MGRWTGLLTIAVVGATLAAAAPVAWAVGGAAAVDKLNAQRAANGIPAGIVHVPEWSHWCELHNAYMALNGMGHSELSSNPGFTPEGAKAGGSSVLSGGDWDQRNPWETAPIHLHQLLAPRLDAMGVGASDGFVCATTLLSRNRPAPLENVVYTYPGPDVVHRFEEEARELPYTPGELIGIPQGTTTGPYLYVMVDGPALSTWGDARFTAASLTGPSGPVPIVTVDNHTPGLEGYLPPGGEIIPRHPLEPGTRYTATVALAAGSGEDETTFVHSWSFSTERGDPQATFLYGHGLLRFSSRSPATGEVEATRRSTGAVAATASVAPGGSVRLALGAGQYRLCVRQPETSGWAASETCRRVSEVGRPRLRLSADGRRTRGGLRIAVLAPPELVGRSATVRWTSVRRVCSSVRPVKGGRRIRSCAPVSRGARARTIALRSARTRVVLPAPRAGRLAVTVTVPRFHDRDAAYLPIPARRTYR